jgi:NACalpha-BTF3-like transcription factor
VQGAANRRSPAALAVHGCQPAWQLLRGCPHRLPSVANKTGLAACAVPAAVVEEDDGEAVDETGVEAKDIDLVMSQVGVV